MRHLIAAFALLAILGFIAHAFSQQAFPPQAPTVCAYNATPPTVPPGAAVYTQCDAQGRLLTSSSSGFSSAQNPINASATGTTGAVTATLPALAGKTTYICGYSIDADATASAVVTATVSGLVSGTSTRRQGVGAVASGTVSTWQTYQPCLPALGVNTSISVNSGAAGTGGNTAVNVWGYQQ